MCRNHSRFLAHSENGVSGRPIPAAQWQYVSACIKFPESEDMPGRSTAIPGKKLPEETLGLPKDTGMFNHIVFTTNNGLKIEFNAYDI